MKRKECVKIITSGINLLLKEHNTRCFAAQHFFSEAFSQKADLPLAD